MTEWAVPLLDLASFRGDGQSSASFVRRVGEALSGVGFFRILNHGVTSAAIRRAYEAAEAFFALPEQVKLTYTVPGSGGQRGFTGFGLEHARDAPLSDLKEFWHVGRELPEDHPLASAYEPNVWPVEVSDFRPALTELFHQLDACSMRLLQAIALFLGEAPDRISSIAEGGNSILRVAHYPPVPDDPEPDRIRAAPHEDINLITLLCEATASGLELLTRDGKWVAIESVPGQIVVDSADMLQNLTNGVLRSTTHRVSNQGGSRERRLSMPFFVHPRSDASLTPLPSCIDRTGGVQQFPAITAGEFLLQRLREIGLVS